MGLIPFVAITLIVATVAVSLITGQRLGEVRGVVFQLEMQAEQLRRRVTDLEQDSKKAEGLVRALTRLRSEKLERLADLFDELQESKSEAKAINVAVGLQKRSYELAEVAA